MPGSAVLGSNLVDELIGDVVDELRGELHPEFGVRQWRVYHARRTWPSGRIGEDDPAPAWVETEITPQPLVVYESYQGAQPDIAFQYGDGCGLEIMGEITLYEVSLTYTEPELLGYPIPAGTEFTYVLRDAYGQSLIPRHYVVAAPPYPDRIETLGWRIRLRATEG